MAEDLKKKHFEENPGYHYQPRKPTEKKRRMTRRKLDTICKSASTHVESSTELASVETFQADGNSTALPDIETIEAGNAAVTYGDETIDDESFEAMLKHYNSTIPDSGPHHGKSTAIYTERTAEANENITLYGAKCFDDIFLGPTQQESLAELDRILGPIEKLDEAWDTLDGSQQAQILSPDFDFGKGDSILGLWSNVLKTLFLRNLPSEGARVSKVFTPDTWHLNTSPPPYNSPHIQIPGTCTSECPLLHIPLQLTTHTNPRGVEHG